MPERDDDLTRLFGARVRELRRARDRALDSFESSAGSAGRLSRIERGLVSPTLRSVELVAEDLGVEAVDLLIDPTAFLRHELIEASRGASHTALAAAIEVLTRKRRVSRRYKTPRRSLRRARPIAKTG